MQINLNQLKTIYALILLLTSNNVLGQTPIAAQIPAAYDVSATGAFTYSLPLTLPAGVKNMVPQLAITYNSQGGNSMMGMGWTVSGLSAITRTVPTLHHFQNIDPVDFDANDAFILDGSILIPSSSPGQFQLYNHNFSIIEQHGTAGSGPDYFTVQYPSGITYEYGNSVNSKMLASGRSDVYIWAVNKIYDKNGNYIEFLYDNDDVNGDYRISSIHYTGNTTNSTLPSSEIKFNYTTRTDKNKAWVAGSILKDEYLIDNIEIKHNGTTLNKYQFTYTLDIYSHLTKIEQIIGNSILPSVDITWVAPNSAVQIASTSNPGSPNPFNTSVFSTGDFNGDGATDYITTLENAPSTASFDYFINSKTDDFNYQSTTSYPVSSGTMLKVNPAIKTSSGKMAMDFDGDGSDDLFLANIDYNPGGSYGSFKLYCTPSSQMYTIGGTHFKTTYKVFEYENTCPFSAPQAPENWIKNIQMIAGDYDGDGRTDLMLAIPAVLDNSGWGETYYLYYLNYSDLGHNMAPIDNQCGLYGNIKANSFYTYAGYLDHELWTIKAMDYNGDGQDELLVVEDAANQIDARMYSIDMQRTDYGSYWQSSSTGILTPVYQGTYPSAEAARNSIWHGDFNGDGKADLLTFLEPINNGTGIWSFSFSKGDQGYDLELLPTALNARLNLYDPTPSMPSVQSLHVADFNGDGKDDVLILANNLLSPGDVLYDMFYSKGYNEFDQASGTLSSFSADHTLLALGDFNGDGQADILLHNRGVAISPKLLYFDKNSQRHLVKSIEHAGKKIDATYLPISIDPDYEQGPALNPITLTPWVSYPFSRWEKPLVVTKSITDNIDVEKHYVYSGAIMEAQGLGLLGFGGIGSTDAISGATHDRMWINYPNYHGPLGTLLMDTYIGDGVAHSTYNYWHQLITPQKTRIIYLDQQTNTNFITGANSTKMFTYNSTSPGSMLYDFGMADEVKDANFSLPFSQITKYTYDAGVPFHNKNKPTEVEVIAERQGKPPYSRKQQYQYDNNGNLSITKNDPGTSNEIVTTNSNFDAFGNAQTTQVSPQGMNMTTAQHSYSTDGRFRLSTLGTYNYTESFEYDNAGWGLLAKYTNKKGQITTYDYDDVHRVIKTTDLATGVEENTEYAFATGTHNPGAGIQFMSTASTTGINGSEINFIDYYGRVRREVSTAFDGNNVYTDAKYNNKGCLTESTVPYFQSTGPAVTTYSTYDNYNREVTRSIPATGYSSNTSYTIVPGGGYTITTTDNSMTGGNTKTSHYDVLGLLAKVEENGNIIDYDLNSNGQADNILINGSYTTTYLYDALGRVKEKTEPNVPVITYEYNALGLVTNKTETNGTVHTFTYDDMDRLIQKQNQTGTYDYVYDNNPNTPTTGNIIDESSSSFNTSYHYNYDPIGRLSEFIENQAGQSFTSTYEYDMYNRVQTKVFPSGDKIERIYNDNGYLEQINLINSIKGLPAQPLWKINTQNHLDQVGECLYYRVNGQPLYRQNRGYNVIGNNTRIITTNLLSGAVVMDQNNIFNVTTGNVEIRRDLLRNLEEVISYDTRDRIKDVSGPGISPNQLGIKMRYDDAGNILHKSDVSTSQYDWYYYNYALARVPQPEKATPRPFAPIPTYTPHVIPMATQDVSYFSIKRVQHIAENGITADFNYYPDHHRAMMHFTDDPIDFNRYYATDYEKTVQGPTEEEISYVWGETAPVAMLYHKTGTISKVFYPLTDRLGSITHIMDNDGSISNGLIEERSFDVWGRSRNPNDWVPHTSNPGWAFDRGYTGHEHLNAFNIINMNARLYDPLTARMYSTDPLVVDNTNVQTYNQYSYVMNNPLKYTDPTGNEPITTAIIIGSIIFGGLTNVAAQYGTTQNFNFGDGVKAFGVGAAASAAGLGVGSLVSTALGSMGALPGALSGVAGGAAGGFVGGAGNVWANGGSFTDGLTAGAQGAAIGGFMGGALGGLAGGLDARAGGLNFWSSDLPESSSVPSNTLSDITADEGTGYGMQARGPIGVIYGPQLDPVYVVTARAVERFVVAPATAVVGGSLMFIGALLLPANYHQPVQSRDYGLPPENLEAARQFAKEKWGTRGEAEHTKNKSKVRADKHGKGISRKQQDRGGAKGMKNPPRNRPKDWKGKWNGHGG